MTEKTITASYLRSLLSYDQDTGDFHRVVSRNPRHPVGAVAGTQHSRGYIVIGLDGMNYKAHRLAWLHVHGEWPTGEIDHINGNKTDNRITNLRIVSRSENMVNRFRARSDNRLGVLGVTQIGGRFIARFKNRYLGMFATPEAAHGAYQKARQGDST
jgi:hypothetical protein